MTALSDNKIVLVVRPTRLDELVVRHNTIQQAQFYVEHLGADFSDYQREHDVYHAEQQATVRTLEQWGRYQIIDRSFLPNFIFGPSDIVVALGQDGLVANTMKYLDGHPLIGLNPDAKRYDGILLPFVANDLPALLREVAADKRPAKAVTMAKAALPTASCSMPSMISSSARARTHLRFTRSQRKRRPSGNPPAA